MDRCIRDSSIDRCIRESSIDRYTMENPTDYVAMRNVKKSLVINSDFEPELYYFVDTPEMLFKILPPTGRKSGVIKKTAGRLMSMIRLKYPSQSINAVRIGRVDLMSFRRFFRYYAKRNKIDSEKSEEELAIKLSKSFSKIISRVQAPRDILQINPREMLDFFRLHRVGGFYHPPESIRRLLTSTQALYLFSIITNYSMRFMLSNRRGSERNTLYITARVDPNAIPYNLPLNTIFPSRYLVLCKSRMQAELALYTLLIREINKNKIYNVGGAMYDNVAKNLNKYSKALFKGNAIDPPTCFAPWKLESINALNIPTYQTHLLQNRKSAYDYRKVVVLS